jgi:ribonuclease P protein subunit POP4
VAAERLTGKYLQLEPPQGKESDERKAELLTRSNEKAKKKKKVLREGECGLIGRRKRKVLAKGQELIVKLVRFLSQRKIDH